ncbi:hypothetical protein Tco_1234336, partial [Tanacetum coccineum]
GNVEISQAILKECAKTVEDGHRNAAALARYTKPTVPIDICLNERIEKTKRSKNDQKNRQETGKKNKESRARVRNQPEITAGSTRLSQRKKQRSQRPKIKSKPVITVQKFQISSHLKF